MLQFVSTGLRFSIAACALCLGAGLATPSVAGEWEWELSPFLWATDAAMDLSIDDTDVSGVEADFSDLIEKLDLGALVHFEGRRNRGGFLAELIYLELSDEKTFVGSPAVPGGTEVTSELEQLIAEVGGFYRIGEDESGLDVLFGLRLFELSTDVAFDFPVATDRSLSRDVSLLDGFAGLRYRGDMGKRWLWWARGDVGAGETDLSLQAIGGVGLKLGKNQGQALWIGYRHLQFEADESKGGIHEIELVFSGLVVGYLFGF
jgi:hypothetical protein